MVSKYENTSKSIVKSYNEVIVYINNVYKQCTRQNQNTKTRQNQNGLYPLKCFILDFIFLILCQKGLCYSLLDGKM